jgi:hypothetical protein
MKHWIDFTLNLFRPEVKEVQKLDEPSTYNKPLRGIAPGKWVITNQHRVGIIFSIQGFPLLNIHYTNEAGETIEDATIDASDVQIAKYKDIPEARRPADYAYAATCLGYI